jgi:hypothetical protein
MKILRFKNFINEQQSNNDEEAVLAALNKGIEELNVFEENKGDKDFMKYVDYMIKQVKTAPNIPAVMRTHMINNFILLKDDQYREVLKRVLDYMKQKLTTGTKLENLKDDPESMKINKELEDTMIRILKVSKDEITNNFSKLLKGSEKFRKIREEEASMVVSTPEDPYGEESWENALSDEEAIKKAFAQDVTK